MLGRFLEFSLPTPDIQASFDFYTKLGFTEAPVADIWTHPYAVVTDGRICLGLHQKADFPPALTFVKPGLLKTLDSLEGMGLEFAYRRLGNDVFNEVGWKDPCGQLIRLLEARTFSPGKRPRTAVSLCGYFQEIALPCVGFEPGKAYWERLGFVGMDELDDRLPHIACTSDFLDLGLYEPAALGRSTLRFEVDDIAASLARLEERGLSQAGTLPAPLRGTASALLIAPEGTPLLLSAAD